MRFNCRLFKLILEFNSLQEISEEIRSRCPQRKRSSSLPVPKIEVSLCSEAKVKESTTTMKVDPVQTENFSFMGTLFVSWFL